MSDMTPPAADLLVRDIAEHDRHIADVEGQLAAQESRIHAMERQHIAQIAFNQEMLVHVGHLRSDRDLMEKELMDLHVCAEQHSWNVAHASDYTPPVKRRGIPRHGGPIGTGLIDVPEVVPQTREEIRESHAVHFEGMGGQ